jgi:hypothetical protein
VVSLHVLPRPFDNDKARAMSAPEAHGSVGAMSSRDMPIPGRGERRRRERVGGVLEVCCVCRAQSAVQTVVAPVETVEIARTLIPVVFPAIMSYFLQFLLFYLPQVKSWGRLISVAVGPWGP